MPDSRPIRVLVVDDNEQFRRGMEVFLSAFDDFTLAGLAADGAEAARLCRERQPDVILMDLVMPGVNGVCATRRLLAEFPKLRIIILSSLDDQAMIRDALHSGAVASLPKNAPIDEMASAIRSAFAYTRCCTAIQ